MELKLFAGGLKIRMNAEIETISANQDEALTRTSQLITCTRKYVMELKRFVVKYKFKSLKEEIEFFKTTKPQFVSQQLFFEKLFRIKLFESYNSKNTKLRYYKCYLKRLESLMSQNYEFYRYVLSGSETFDGEYFTRNTKSEQSPAMDERFSTFYDLKLSRILCNEVIKGYLIEQTRELEHPRPESERSNLTWTGGKTDLIELIYALQASEVFNKGNAGVKQIASQFEIVFNVSLSNCYRTFQEIRLRKKNQTQFLDEIKQKLKQRLDDVR